MKKEKTFLFFVFLLFSINLVPAATYYVDTNDPAANDGGVGTEALPFKSIQKAANLMRAGDTAVVKAGIYNENVTTNASGTSNSYITFKADPGAIIQGFVIIHNYIKIEGFEITNNKSYMGGITIKGNYSIVSNNYIHHIQGSPAILSRWEDKVHHALIVNNSIYHSQYGIFINGKNWVVENNEIERLYKYTNESGADADYTRFFGEGHIIKNNYFHDTLQSEVGNAHVDGFQTFDQASRGTYAKNITIDNNMVIDFHQGVMMEANNVRNSSFITIVNNVFARSLPIAAGDGIIDQDIPYVTVVNNTFYLSGAGGILISPRDYSFATNAFIKNNLIYLTYNSNFSYVYSYNFFDEETVGNYNLIYGVARTPSPRAGVYDILGKDPLFVNASNIVGLDGIPFTVDDGLRLQEGSPAIGAGEGGSDIGAYSYVNLSRETNIETPPEISGAIVNAASCSFPDVQRAVTIAEAGYIVNVPSGVCSWNASSSLIINKSIILQGAGAEYTKIIHDVNLSTIVISPSADVPIRVTGFYIDKANNYQSLRRAITIVGSKRGDYGLTKIRIDHNTFNKGGRQVYWTGWAYGLTDHNTFINGNIAVGFTGDNNHSWKRPIQAGSADAVFVEDNLFIIDNKADREPNHQIYHQEGYRTVIRNNIFNASTYNRTDCGSGTSICYANFFDSHGNLNMYTGTNSDMRGQPIVEVYNNIFHAYRAYNHMAIRGGSLLIYNNKFSCDNSPCTSKNVIRFEEEESWTTGGPFPNKPATTIWPAQDQIANSFLWNNTYNGVLIANVSLTAENEPFFIQEGRDYWMHEPQITGGKTIYTDRPGGNETFVQGPQAYYPYVPYPYPHPLSQSSENFSEPVSGDEEGSSSEGTSGGGSSGGGGNRIDTLDSLSKDSAGNVGAGSRQGLNEDEKEKELTPKEIEKMIEEENIKEAFNTEKASYAKVILYGFLGMVFFAIVIVGFLIARILRVKRK